MSTPIQAYPLGNNLTNTINQLKNNQHFFNNIINKIVNRIDELFDLKDKFIENQQIK